LDGPIDEWFDEKEWIRHNNKKVALKNLDQSSNLHDKFLTEV